MLKLKCHYEIELAEVSPDFVHRVRNTLPSTPYTNTLGPPANNSPRSSEEAKQIGPTQSI